MPATNRVPANHELLASVDSHLPPCAGALARFIGAVEPLWRRCLLSLARGRLGSDPAGWRRIAEPTDRAVRRGRTSRCSSSRRAAASSPQVRSSSMAFDSSDIWNPPAFQIRSTYAGEVLIWRTLAPRFPSRIHRCDVGSIAHGVRRGECGWNFLRHLCGGRPLGSTLERYDEADTTERRNVVPQGCVEDPPTAIADYHQDRLIPASALIGGVRIRSGENRHVCARATKRRIQLVPGVHPHFGQTF